MPFVFFFLGVVIRFGVQRRFFFFEKKRPKAGILNIYDVDARFFLLLSASFSKLAGRWYFFFCCFISHCFFSKYTSVNSLVDLHGICSI